MTVRTLGGDRVGAGKKMQVKLHGYERSTHDLGNLFRTTMAAGTLVPFYVKVALPGDTWDINLDIDIKTHPTIGSLFGSMKIQLDMYVTPMRLYNALLHNNKLNIGLHMERAILPTITLKSSPTQNLPDLENSQTNPSSLLAYCGIRGVGSAPVATERTFNACALLTYYDIYKNYYANKMEDNGVVIHTPAEAIVETIDAVSVQQNNQTFTILQSPAISGITLNTNAKLIIEYTGAPPIPSQIIFSTNEHGDVTMLDLCNGGISDTGSQLEGIYVGISWGTTTVKNWRYKDTTDINTGKPKLAPFPLGNIDKMREAILARQSETDAFEIMDTAITPYIWLGGTANGTANALSSQEGLAVKTYQSDKFNNWLNTEWIDGAGGISEITAVDTTQGYFTIDTLNLSKKVYMMMNRIMVSGGTYHDWIESVYDTDRIRAAETPMYMGGLSRELVFQSVVSNSETTDQPLGTLGGRGVMGNKKKGGHVTIKTDEPSYIMGIVSITPRVDYSQGNEWDVNLKTFDDLHKPQLDEIGFQDLIMEEMAWWTTEWDGSKWVQKSAGKQPAWLQYMTSYNKTFGNFAIKSNEMFMTLNRRYEGGEEGNNIEDMTTYIDPSKYNFIFAQTSLDAQNFWVNIGIDAEVRRKMSAKLMPNM